MSEICPHCGLNFTTLHNSTPDDTIWVGLKYHLENCVPKHGPIVTVDGALRLLDAIVGDKQSGREVERCGKTDARPKRGRVVVPGFADIRTDSDPVATVRQKRGSSESDDGRARLLKTGGGED